MSISFRAAVPVILLLLTACSNSSDGPGSTARLPETISDPVPREEPRSEYGNPDSYVVHDNRYFVMRSSAGYSERGIASWYGKKFHGKRASSGEIYDMYEMTAAHKTLPLPTYVRVTNLKNQRSVIVRVNDRGPFVSNRIIDLSYAAAAKLDMLVTGTALVEIQEVSATGENKTPADQAAIPDWRDQSHLYNRLFVQVGSFSVQYNADVLKQQLLLLGFEPVQIIEANQQESILYRVRIGPLADVAATDAIIERLEQNSFADYQIIIE